MSEKVDARTGGEHRDDQATAEDSSAGAEIKRRTNQIMGGPRKSIGVLLVLALLPGCVSPLPRSPESSFARVPIEDYAVNRPTTVTVGSRMIGWGFETIYGGYRTVTSDGLQVELVYGGIDHNVISVLYREYGRTSDGWFVRPGYSQDLRYDLNVAKSIAFREVRITVENADQESITFTVTKSPVVPSDTLIHISGRAQSDQVGTSRAGFEFDRTGTVTRVVKNSPADSAGVAVDDEIFEINSERFPEGDIAAALKILESPGRNWIRLFVWRGQYKTQLEVRKP